ncbi:YaaA family protein [Corynebacterium sp. Marseille-P4321]|uniref:YaaA family protein n=1 Tax=Corynebacterium sp. Marseille-P4321 TaxID=2736603 RepID=UPI0015887A27|nr:peroxide stress protein YaaA [Corynebacterium sp. Marseille-P4321]
MLIVLPPSETKAPGGEFDGMSLSFPALDPIRTLLIDELSHTPVDTPQSKRDEAAENFTLRTNPVMPAAHRYTGVLYDALGATTLPEGALEHLAIGSALFGVVRASDTIPRYRLSGGTKLAGKTMKAWWGSAISDVLAEQGFMVDMRSGAYKQLGPVPDASGPVPGAGGAGGAGAMTVRVEQADTGKVVSHFNKRYKGELARSLASSPTVADAQSISDIADLAAGAGFRVEVRGDELVLLI